MSGILLPRRYLDQPQTDRVRLAPGYDVKFAMMPPYLRDLVSGVPADEGLINPSYRSFGVNQSGNFIRTISQASGSTILPRWKYGPLPKDKPFALLLRAAIPLRTSFGILWSNHSGGGQWRIKGNYFASGSVTCNTWVGAIGILTAGGGYSNISAKDVVDGSPHTYLFVRDGTKHEIWVDGTRRAVAEMVARDVSGTKLNGPAMSFNNSNNVDLTSANYSGPQDCSLFAMLGYVEDPASLSANPWQIFEAEPVRIYFDMGSSSTSFDAEPSSANVQTIKSKSVVPVVTVTRSSSSPAGTVYFSIYSSSLGTPTATQVIAGQDSTGSTSVASGSETCITSSGTQIFSSPATGLIPETSYKISFVISDGSTNSIVAEFPTPFVTLKSVRSIILQSGEMTEISDVQEGTGLKPLVLLSGELKERATTEGIPVILKNGELTTIDPTTEDLQI